MTAVAGRRMAETVARRGAIAVIPQDIPIEVVAEVIAWVKQRHLVHDTAITLGPTDTVGDAIHLLPKRAHGAVVVVDADGRPVGVVTEADCVGVDRFAQLRHVMSTELLTVPAEADPRRGVRPALDRPAPDRAGRRRRGPPGRRADPPGRAARHALPPGAGREGAAADRRGDRHQRRRRRQGRRAAGGRGGHARRGHRARAPGADDHGAAGRTARSSRRRADRRRATWSPRTAYGTWSTPGADIVKVGVGPGAMCTTRMMTGVGRPQFSAVLDCAAAARELGRHVWADGGVRHPARRRAGAGRRRLQRDDRVVVRRHVRVAGRPLHRRGRPALQGELRHGVGPRGQRPHRRRQRVRPGPQGGLRGGHLARRGCSSTRRARASRT